MNDRVFPFVRIASKRTDQLQLLQQTVRAMIRARAKLALDEDSVSCLTGLDEGITVFCDLLLSTAAKCLALEPAPGCDDTDDEEVPLSFPSFNGQGGDTPPDNAG